jgi:HD-like signal output (HDOD) protein
MTTTAKPALVTIEQLVAEASDLAALPQVVMRVIDMTIDPKTTATDVERVVGTDQALAGRILALANSSYYGLPRRISSLREAVVFLGFKAIRNLAMAVTTFNLFVGKSDAPSLARRELWRHAMDTAQCARIVGTMLHPSDREAFATDEAFTCGLLHDVGKLVLDRSRHALFVTISETARTHKTRFHVIEAQALPWSHSQLGMTLAARWNLPLPVCETIGFHHTPRAAQANPRLTATVALANELAHFLTETSEMGPDRTAQHWQQTLADSMEMLTVLRLTPEKAHSMASACRAEMDKGLTSQMMPN